MVGECKCQTNKLTIRIERSGKYVVRGGRIKDKKIIHARVRTHSILSIIISNNSIVINNIVVRAYGMFVCISYSASLHVCTLLYSITDDLWENLPRYS